MIFTSWSWSCHAFMWYHTQAVPLPQVIHCFGNRKDLWGRQEAALPIRPVNLVVEDVLRTSESVVTDFWSYQVPFSPPHLSSVSLVMLALVCFHAQEVTVPYFPFIQPNTCPALPCTCSAHLVIQWHCWQSTSRPRLETMLYIFHHVFNTVFFL